MKAKRLIGILTLNLGLTLALLAGLQMVQAAPVATNFFVGPGGTGTTCSRLQPCTILTALAQATNGDSIYAARGDYTGTGTDVISITNSITLYGGWDGAVFGPIMRDSARYPSVLDGEGMRRVVYISGNITPTLDGFIITRGNATGLPADCSSDGCGGGIFIHSAHPIIVNNVISDNVAATASVGSLDGRGGALYLEHAARSVISGNVIISNVASTVGVGDGGGIYLSLGADMGGTRVQFNQILSNTATTSDTIARGGGIYGGPDGVLIQGNIVAGNQANSYGGGAGAGFFQWYGSATYLNNMIRGNLGNDLGNSAVFLGYSQSRFEGNQVIDNLTANGVQVGAISGGGPTLVNNVIARSGSKTFSVYGYSSSMSAATLFHNTLVGSGAGYGVYGYYAAVYLTNTIIVSHTWGITNTPPASSTILADHTLFWANTNDGIRGISSVDGDPAFAADGYHILTGSAAYNRGAAAGVTTDIDGDLRPDSCSPDIGADELVTGFGCWHVYLPVIIRN